MKTAVLARAKCGHMEWLWARGLADQIDRCFDCRYIFSAMEWRFEWHWAHMGFKPPFGDELHEATRALRAKT